MITAQTVSFILHSVLQRVTTKSVGWWRKMANSTKRMTTVTAEWIAIVCTARQNTIATSTDARRFEVGSQDEYSWTFIECFLEH